jgi:hypothetical protein
MNWRGSGSCSQTCGRKVGAMAAVEEDHAVDARAQLGEGVGFVA